MTMFMFYNHLSVKTKDLAMSTALLRKGIRDNAISRTASRESLTLMHTQVNNLCVWTIF